MKTIFNIKPIYRYLFFGNVKLVSYIEQLGILSVTIIIATILVFLSFFEAGYYVSTYLNPHFLSVYMLIGVVAISVAIFLFRKFLKGRSLFYLNFLNKLIYILSLTLILYGVLALLMVARLDTI